MNKILLSSVLVIFYFFDFKQTLCSTNDLISGVSFLLLYVLHQSSELRNRFQSFRNLSQINY